MNPYPFTRTKHFNERQWQRGLDEVLLQSVLKDIPQGFRKENLCITVSRQYVKSVRMTRICNMQLSPNQYLVIVANRECLVTVYKMVCPQYAEFQTAHPKRIILGF
jgi:hypothetical protein